MLILLICLQLHIWHDIVEVKRHYVTTAFGGIHYESDARPEETTYDLEQISCIDIGEIIRDVA